MRKIHPDNLAAAATEFRKVGDEPSPVEVSARPVGIKDKLKYFGKKLYYYFAKFLIFKCWNERRTQIFWPLKDYLNSNEIFFLVKEIVML